MPKSNEANRPLERISCFTSDIEAQYRKVKETTISPIAGDRPRLEEFQRRMASHRAVLVSSLVNSGEYGKKKN
jgi:hypothetical protein